MCRIFLILVKPVFLVLGQFKPKTTPVAVLVIWWEDAVGVNLFIWWRRIKSYGGSGAPPAEAHKTRWRLRWPPKIICLNNPGTPIRDRTIIFVYTIWFSGTRNSKNIFSISPEDHVTLLVKVVWKNWPDMVSHISWTMDDIIIILMATLGL